MTEPNISVIVPHYDDLVRLDRCLAALCDQSLSRDRYEIVVADNMSPAGEVAVNAAIAGRARLVFAPDKGAGPARNAGVASSRGAMLAFTDSDCLPERQWIEAGISALDRFDLVGGRVKVVAEHDGAKSGAEGFEAVFAFDNEGYVRDKNFTVTANLFCSRAVFDATGPFRVGMSEDVDWCLRARAAGFQIGYVAGAVASHPPRPDWPSLHKKWQRLNAELFELALLRPAGRLKWFLHALALPLSILVHAPKVMRSPALADNGERVRALATLVRLRMWRFLDANLRLIGVRR